MKCDELKSLKNIEIAFNTTTQQEQVTAEDSEGNCYGFDSWEEVYLKDEVDAAIAELKQKLAEKESWVKMLGEGEAALSLELEKTKQKLEDAKATAYAESVDAGMRERRLRRALWRAIALFCARSCEYFNGIMSHCLIGQEDLYKRCEKKKNKYLHAMYKCRAKMEEYK